MIQPYSSFDDSRQPCLPNQNRFPIRILLVDDAPALLKVYQLALRSPERELVAMTDSRQALQIALSEPFHLILLDVQMPDLDGFEFCRRLKADPRSQRIPVVFASGTPNLERQAALLGAAGCLHKPFRMEELKRAVEQWSAHGDALTRRPMRARARENASH